MTICPIKTTIIFISIVMGFLTIPQYLYASSDNTISSQDIIVWLAKQINNITQTITTQGNNSDNTNPTLVLNHLCNYLHANKDKQIIESLQWDQRYRHESSLFVAIVCDSISALMSWTIAWTPIADNTLPIQDKKRIFSWLWLICPPVSANSDTNLVPHNCVSIPPSYKPYSKNDQTQIDYQRLMLNTITPLLNDIANISTARIYGATDTTRTKKTRDLANEYLTWHYATVGHITESKPYTQTTAHLQSYIQAGNRIYRNMKIIDLSDEKVKALPDGQRKDFLINTAGWTWYTDMVDVLYNEYFFYQLFSAILVSYQENIRSTITDIPPALRQPGQNDTKFYINQHKQHILHNHTTIIDTIDDTLKELNQLQSRFPIHIGLMLYQEDLLTMRNSFAKIYLPIHQLHYKLENVQSKE